jgi:hypothetical protein
MDTRTLLAGIALAVTALAGAAVRAEDKVPARQLPDVLLELRDQSVDLELGAGTLLKQCRVGDLISDAQGKPSSVEVWSGSKPTRRIVALPGIRKVLVAGRVRFDASKSRDPVPAPPKPPVPAPEAKVDEKAAAAPDKAGPEEPVKPGVRPWPELSPPQHEATIAEHRKLVEEVSKTFKGMRVVEAQHYVICSNLAPADVEPLARAVDQTYFHLLDLLALPRHTRVFRGRALVLAFASRDQMRITEARLLPLARRITSSLNANCHQYVEGDVIITCFQDNDSMLASLTQPDVVRQTTMAVLFRQQTMAVLPAWVEQGLAEREAKTLLAGTPGGLQLGDRDALLQLKRTRSLGGTFFEPTADLESYQKFAACWLTELLIEKDPKGYRQLLEHLKAGVRHNEALKRALDATPADLAKKLGAAVDVSDLKP